MIYYAHGRFQEGKIALSPEQPAFRQGAGFFETIYYNGESLCHIDAHLARIHGSLAHFGLARERTDLTGIMAGVLERNDLAGRSARVNLFYPVEQGPCLPVVLAAPYEPQPDRVISLWPCPEHHVSPLNAHKSMNYFFFAHARTQAVDAGFDDALLTDHDGLVLETCVAGLLFAGDEGLVEPESPYKLPSTAVEAVRGALQVRSRPVHRDELAGFRHGYALNSLMGMRPVVRIGDLEFIPDEAACSAGSRLILG